ncbi:MAG: hydantoinase/carbamoylase family amidase [Candidatus Aminicenantes bacterium]|nr:hydantoinase/carbamoylase family amidase [Candidatus Aminicenantes bacterium]
MKSFLAILLVCFWVSGTVCLFPQDESVLEDLRINQNRFQERLDHLAEFGKNEHGGIDRVAFSHEDKKSRKYIISLMKQAGLEVRIDAAANILGRKEGKNPELPPILFGSHSDTVPDGGKFDGALGVLGAIECIQVLKENQITTLHPLEVVVFTDEEGGLVGSRAMTGTLTPEALDVVSHSGKTVREGIQFLGGEVNNLDEAIRRRADIKAFLELHIEQGSVLHTQQVDIGVVEGIVGIYWWDVTVRGFSNHAGTTPMDMRKDALLAAAHLIIAVNDVVTTVPGSQVGTVGKIKAEPGAPNVIPGLVELSLELRDLSEEKVRSLFGRIKNRASEIVQNTGTEIKFIPLDANAEPAPTDLKIRHSIDETAKDLGLTSIFMPSGAGHDAQDMAKITPTGMIFVPSVGGISHSPKEFTKLQDCANGINVLLHSVLKIDRILDESGPSF